MPISCYLLICLVFIQLFIDSISCESYYVSLSGNDNNNCNSIGTACKSLKEGLNKAMSESDVIYVDDGRYTGDDNRNLTINNDVTITKYSTGDVIFDCENNIITFINTNGNNVDISNINMMGCQRMINHQSGGILSLNSVNITGCAHSSSSSMSCIDIDNNSEAHFNNLLFQNNGISSTQNIYIRANSGTVSIHDSIFTENTGDYGGVIRTESSSPLDIINCIINGNTASIIIISYYY